MIDLVPGCTFHIDPEPGWQAELDRLAPPHPLKSRLVLRWHPGREFFSEEKGCRVWQPIERWIVYELIPTARMSPNFPAVKTLESFAGVIGGLELERKNVDRAQWELWLDTGQFGRPIWVVQGTQGGHKRRFSEQERLLLSRLGYPEDAPYPGQLSFAPVDGRVFRQLRTLVHRSEMWNQITMYADAAWDTLDREERAEALQCRKALSEWSEQQMFDVLDSTSRADRAEFRDALPVGLSRPDNLADPDDALAAFIEEGVRQ